MTWGHLPVMELWLLRASRASELPFSFGSQRGRLLWRPSLTDLLLAEMELTSSYSARARRVPAVLPVPLCCVLGSLVLVLVVARKQVGGLLQWVHLLHLLLGAEPHEGWRQYASSLQLFQYVLAHRPSQTPADAIESCIPWSALLCRLCLSRRACTPGIPVLRRGPVHLV